MTNVQEIMANDFAEQVEAHQGTVLVDFFAQWCGPCKVIAPIVEEVATEFDTLKVVKVDADNAQELMQKYGIRSIPTLVMFKDGELEASNVGAVSLPKLREFVSENL
ncbi:thioredoxin [Agaribacter marinus]|uniref:Thioredoxin n=1 Tax=Agaribacter marinus TaxID=1431249 RepID=A0AA37T2P1_9ALTE|nr:thioredoxin [Agaribacter marinus]GLR70570.1 thioredoxin [Agaribacter marinus]